MEKGPSYTTSEGGNQSSTEQTTCRSAFLNLPGCQRTFPRQRNGKHEKEFCTSTCKDAYHKAAHEMGQEAIKKMNTPRRQHFAKLENSPRLQRILEILKDGGWHSTLEIQNRTSGCAIGASMSELNKNGIRYETRIIDGHYEYRLLPGPFEIKEQADFFKTDYSGQVVSK